LEKRVDLALGRSLTNRAQVLRTTERHREVAVAIVELGDRQFDLGNAGPGGALLDGDRDLVTREQGVGGNEYTGELLISDPGGVLAAGHDRLGAVPPRPARVIARGREENGSF